MDHQVATFLMLFAAGAAGAAEPLLSLPGDEAAPQADPRGRWLVFEHTNEGTTNLLLLDLRGGPGASPKPLAPHPANSREPRISPDGRRLAFISTRADALGDLFVLTLPDGEPRRLTDSTTSDRAPRWITADSIEIEQRRGAGWERTVLDARTGQPEPGAAAPADTGAGAPFPLLAANGELALLRADDTNRDGRLDDADDASLWRRGADGWSQVALPLAGASGLARLGDELVVSAEGPDGLDLFVLPVDESLADPPVAADRAQVGVTAEMADAAALARWRGEALRSGSAEAAAQWLRSALARGEIATLLEPPAFLDAMFSTDAAARWNYGALRIEAELRGLTVATLEAAQESAAVEALARRARAHAAAMPAGADSDVAAQFALARLGMFARTGDTARALELAAELEGSGAMDRDPGTQAAFLAAKAGVYRRLGQFDESARFRLAALGVLPADDPRARLLAREVLGDATAQSPDDEARLLAIRAVSAENGRLPALLAESRLAQARLLDRIGEPEPALEAARLAVEDPDTPAAAASEALLLEADILGSRGRFEEAVRLLAASRERLGAEGAATEAALRAALVRGLSAQGRAELRAGDAALAQATYGRLTELVPEAYQGWRGRVAALAAMPNGLDAVRGELRRAAKSDAGDARAQYLYGLLLTYEESKVDSAEKYLRRAVALDGSNAFHHQTLGYVLEQRALRGRRNERLAEAQERYERALALTDAGAAPQDHADLLLNAGNAAFAQERFPRAWSLYLRRAQSPSPFENDAQEFLFRRSAGIAAFRAYEARRAEESFAAALRLLESPGPALLGATAEPVRAELSRELRDRRALALWQLGRAGEAAELWEGLAPLADKRSMDAVRLRRNAALARLDQVESSTGAARADAFAAAEAQLAEARALLPGARLEGPAKGGPFAVDVVVASDATTGGADLRLDRAEEERLLRLAHLRLASLRGDDEAAARGLADELAFLSAPVPEEQLAYRSTQRSLLQRRLAEDMLASGDRTGALLALAGVVDEARFVVKDEPLVNAAAASAALLRLAELGGSADTGTAARLDASWIAGLGAPEPAGAAGAVDRAAARLLAAQFEGLLEATPLVESPEARMRLGLARLLELRSAVFAPGAESEGTPERALREARRALAVESAEALVRALREDAQTATDGVEANGLLLRAHALRLSLAARFAGDERTDSARAEALAFARASGHGDSEWWLHAEEALASRDAQRRDAALERARVSAAALLPSSLTGRSAELASLLPALRDANAATGEEAVWRGGEEWALAELRLAFAGAVPGDGAWGAGFVRLRDARDRLLGRLRSTPPAELGSAEFVVSQLARAEEALAAHLDAGRADGDAFANALFAAPTPFEDASVVYDLGGLLGVEAALPGADAAGRVLLSPGPVGVAGAASVVRVLSGAHLLWALSDPPLELRTADGAVLGERVLRGPIREVGASPLDWEVGEERRRLGDFAAEEPAALWSVEAELVPGARLAVAAALASQGAASVRFPGGEFFGAPRVDPAGAPDVALARLAAARGEAFAAIEENDAERAAPALVTTLALSEALGETGDRTLLLELLAQALGDSGRYEEALGPAAAAVEARRADGGPEALAKSLARLGGLADRARRHDAAERSYTEAGELFASLGDEASRLGARTNIGLTLERSGEYARAAAEYAAVRADAAAAGDRALALESLGRVARILALRQNRYAEAEELLREGLAEAPAGSAEAIGLRIDLAYALERTARYDEALAELGAAQEEAKAAELPLLEALALKDRANVLWLRSDYFESFTARTDAEALAARLGDTELRIALRNVAGLTAWSVNDLPRAMAEFDDALSLSRRASLPTEEASTLNNRGLALRSQGLLEEALADLRAAEAIDTAQGNRWGAAYAKRNIALTLIEALRPAEALPYLADALAYAEAIGDRANMSKTRLAAGDALRALDRRAEAEAAYREALAIADAVPLREVQWRAHYGLAELLLADGPDPAAAPELERALGVLDTLRAGLRVEEFQEGFLADKQAPYDALVELLLDLGREEEALAVSERARGRNFLDLLGNRRPGLRTPEENELSAREREASDAILALERRLGAAPAAKRAEIESELARARAEYSSLLVRLRAANPQLSSFVRVEPVDLDALRALLEPETALVVYHLLEDEAVLWVVRRDGITARRSPVSRAEVAARVGSLRERLQDLAPVDAEIAAMSEALIAPAMDGLSGAARIGFVPHRELHTLPFPALRERSGGPLLIEGYALFHLPSASVLPYSVERRTPEPRARQELRVLAVGNPETNIPGSDLPFAQKEAERLRFEYPDITVATGGAATEEWVGANAGGYDVIHIASHGEYNPLAPMVSGLLLAGKGDGEGRLTSEEIFALPLAADLVALSACQTGLGRVTAGDEVVGLNRAFLYAGTRQIVSTLWRVDDIATAVLFKHFYRNDRDLDRAEALRQAQLRVAARYPHPAYWSGVALTGDWR
ncbi:MAG: CHAT domain-containing protein [Candidatus Sumerlaeia bacterium]|nr:CHAT domain-containing protein [Candidatus Sumerlaeia bacterium]